MTEFDALLRRLEDAIAVLGTTYDLRLWRAFERGRRVARGVLVPESWWERVFMLRPTREQFLEAVPAALADLDAQLRRCHPQESYEKARHREPRSLAGPCLLSDRCEKCASRHGLQGVVQDCSLGPSTGLRMACATLCEQCMNVPLSEIFGPAEIAVRIGRHSAH